MDQRLIPDDLNLLLQEPQHPWIRVNPFQKIVEQPPFPSVYIVN